MIRSLVLFAIAFLCSAPYWGVYHLMADEAVLTYGAERILAGEWIYRDWDTHLSPGSFLVSSLWFGLVGLSTPAPRILFGLVSALTAVGVDLCARRCFVGGWSYLPGLLWCSCGVMEFPILSYHWMASAAVIFVVWSLLRWVDAPGRTNAFLAGGVIALTGWLLQSEGAACLLMTLLCWWRFRPKGILWLLTGLMSVSLLLWLPVFSEWQTVFSDNLGLGGHLAYNRKPYSWSYWRAFLADFQGLSLKVGPTAFLAASSYLAMNALRYLGTPLILVGVWWHSRRRADRPGLLLVYTMLAWILATANRHTIAYVAFMNPLWILVLTRAVWLLPRGRYFALALCLWELVAGTCRSLHLVEVARYPVHARRGVLYSMNPAEAASTNAALAILQQLRPGTDVLAFPYAMQFYWLAGVHNPTRWMTQVPGLNSEDSLVASRQMVDEKRVDWLLYFGTDPVGWSIDYAVTPDEVKTEWEKLRKTMTEGYEPVTPPGVMVVYRRKQ